MKKSRRYSERYTVTAGDENGWMTFQEIGDLEGISMNRVSQIYNGAMAKIAHEVFRSMRGRNPDAKELSLLSKNESLIYAVAEAMQSSEDQQDHDLEG